MSDNKKMLLVAVIFLLAGSVEYFLMWAGL